jgi:hypothetical protein
MLSINDLSVTFSLISDAAHALLAFIGFLH